MLYLAILWTRWNGSLHSKLNKYIRSGDKKTLKYLCNMLPIKLMNTIDGYHTINMPGHCLKTIEINTFSPTMSQLIILLGKTAWRGATIIFTTTCSISWEMAVILLLILSSSYIIVGLTWSCKLVLEKLEVQIKRINSTNMLESFWISINQLPVIKIFFWEGLTVTHHTSNLVITTLFNGWFLM